MEFAILNVQPISIIMQKFAQVVIQSAKNATVLQAHSVRHVLSNMFYTIIIANQVVL